MPRKKITTDELHSLLEREFRNSAADLCRKCRVPRPVFIESKSGGSNWRLGKIDECASLCHTVLDDVAEKLAAQYDLKG
jgi:hypothetical protein